MNEQGQRKVSRSKTVSMPLQPEIIRKSLTDQHRALLYRQAMQRKTVSEVETASLDPHKTEEISKKNDFIFLVFQILIGCAIMGSLLVIVPMVAAKASSTYDSFRYGEHPMTHIEGLFGLPGETPCSNMQDVNSCKLTHIIAMNQEGTIVVIVVPPSDGETKIYALPGFAGFPANDVPSIERTTIQNAQGIRVQVDNAEWYLVVRNGQFVIAQL